MKLNQDEKFVIVKALVLYWQDCKLEDEADDVIKLIVKICEAGGEA